MPSRSVGFWFLHIPGWLLLFYLMFAQAIPAFDYQLGVSMGTQEPASRITDVGVAFFWGFAFGDLVTYIPLLAIGLVGHWMAKDWSPIVISSALGITVYWPIVCLSTVVAAQDAENWSLPNEGDYWIVLPVITLWAVYGLWFILMQRK